VWIASVAAILTFAVHLLGMLPIYGWETVRLESINADSGRGYNAPFHRSFVQRLGDRRVFLTEDSERLGPANSLHADIRALGGGAFSVWGEWIYFSATDNTDPRANHRAYVAHVPAIPPAFLVIMAFAGAIASSIAGLRALDRHRLAQGMKQLGLNIPFLAFAAAVLLQLAIGPWHLLLQSTGGRGDYARVLAAIAASVAFAAVRASDLPGSVSVVIRFVGVYTALMLALRWYPHVPDRPDVLDTWFYGMNRWLGVVTAVVAWSRPALLIYATCSSLWARQAHERVTGVLQADVDEAPVADMVLFLVLTTCAGHLLLSARRASVETRQQVFELGLFAAMGVHLANYFHSAIAKIGLEGPTASWIYENPTHALLSNASELGVAPIAAVPWLFDAAYRGMGDAIIAVNGFTFSSQLISLPALFFAPVLSSLFVLYDIWHLVVMGTTGIFFWKWIVVNAAFVAALRKLARPALMSSRLLAAVLCVVAPSSFHIFAAGWYDTYHLNRLKVWALAGDRWVRVPPAFFLHYSFAAASSVFWSASASRALNPTTTYGATLAYATMRGSKSCGPGSDRAVEGELFNPNMAGLVRVLHARAVSAASPDGRPSGWAYRVYPFHITTAPFAFEDFWSLDLRDVKAYVVELQAVCTARASLHDRVVVGPRAQRIVDVAGVAVGGPAADGRQSQQAPDMLAGSDFP
jgi:hypothetical protein